MLELDQMLVTNVGEWDIPSKIVSMMEINHTDGWQEQEGSFDSYDPVVGKWMTNLVATTPIMAKAKKSLYAKLNRQKDLKRLYRKKYKDLQPVVTTTTDPPVTLP